MEKALAWHPRGVYLCEPEIFQALIAEVRRLREIVSKLPVTADGVSVIPYHTAILNKYGKPVVFNGCRFQGFDDKGDLYGVYLDQCYSTRQAAEAAIKGTSSCS